jgi:hypothetical protein
VVSVKPPRTVDRDPKTKDGLVLAVVIPPAVGSWPSRIRVAVIVVIWHDHAPAKGQQGKCGDNKFTDHMCLLWRNDRPHSLNEC